VDKTVWKFPISVSNESESLPLPEGANYLHVAIQPGSGPCVWVEVEPERAAQNRFIQVFGTGHTIPETAKYIGTWQEEPFVWHLYEVRK